MSADTDVDRQAAFMLLSIVGDLRIGTSPRPTLVARLIVPQKKFIENEWMVSITHDAAAS